MGTHLPHCEITVLEVPKVIRKLVINGIILSIKWRLPGNSDQQVKISRYD